MNSKTVSQFEKICNAAGLTKHKKTSSSIIYKSNNLIEINAELHGNDELFVMYFTERSGQEKALYDGDAATGLKDAKLWRKVKTLAGKGGKSSKVYGSD